MNRRELLRLLSMAGAVVGLIDLDHDRMDHFAGRGGPLDAVLIDEYAALNSHLWRVFLLSKSKSDVTPLVRSHLDTLTAALQQAGNGQLHRRLCALTGDLFQLAGEVFFDGNQYTHAAHCYTLAATASREAGTFDLWACALTRHAFVGLYERRYRQTVSMLVLAESLADRGDRALATRHWVAAVQAQAFAGLGDLAACDQALETAGQISELDRIANKSGWLRFDGSRLAEERGACYTLLGRPDLAEVALTDALESNPTARRRASVLTDLAVLGARRGDVTRLVTYADSVLATARETGSGFVSRKLDSLRAELVPLLGNRQVQELSGRITELVTTS